MENVDAIIQDPAPGTHLLRYQGDELVLTLTLPHPAKGRAFVRTNVGRGGVARAEIVQDVHEALAPLGRDWYDLPMTGETHGRFSLRLPLVEVGHFEAKAYFLPNGSDQPLWPLGKNTAVNVSSATICCANIIYNAFVRQFGPNKAGLGTLTSEAAEQVRALDGKGYTVIPPSGTFRQLKGDLDFILGELGCRFLLLLPIHPTPTTYARMGRFGSPYASLSFTAVDPALAEFDTAATPLEQFLELVDAIHRRRGGLLIDIAINHTGWAASLHESHPQWLVRGADGHIEMPGAWGVTWADLTRLDYSRKDLWRYMADVFLTWCRRGVDGFRCDAGYMIPVAAWQYIIARVRECFPETIFFLEGLGGKISVTRDLLNRAGFDWAYSELFQNDDREAIEHYLPEADDISQGDGVAVHFAETHDNNRLAARSTTWARMRTALSALFSHQGGFAFTNGVEWLATEKIDVHGAPSLNWGAAENQVDLIRRLNALLRSHPAFFPDTEQRMIQTGQGNHLVLRRCHRPTGQTLLIAVNLDAEQPGQAQWPTAEMAQTDLFDLLGDEPVTASSKNSQNRIDLAPGQIRCLTADTGDRSALSQALASPRALPARVLDQRLRAKALAVWSHFQGPSDLADFDAGSAAGALAADPAEFCRQLAPKGAPPKVVTWSWPTDLRREVMVPPEHFLLVSAEAPFRARMAENGRTLVYEESLDGGSRGHFALFNPLPVRKRSVDLFLSVYDSTEKRPAKARLRFLPRVSETQVQGVFGRKALLGDRMIYLGTNGRGGMLRAAAAWGRLFSRYDALLAANFNPDWPEDRWVLLTRIRAWLVYQKYSQEICVDCQTDFLWEPGGPGRWTFAVPTGQGEHVRITLTLAMADKENRMALTAHRHRAGEVADRLHDDRPVTLIFRPDVESRNFHETTKAFTGPEKTFPDAVRPRPDGFVFDPTPGKGLEMAIAPGRFVSEPEWQYMVHRPVEAERGLDPDSDLFSPGYFSLALAGGETGVLTARTDETTPTPGNAPTPLESIPGRDPVTVLAKSLEQYLVRRGNHLTVIAGYPWFLDWGRDTLIVTRGLIAAGMTAAARDVLIQFAAFSQGGTLPNMIRGNDTGNRDTSDAPLWLFTACRDLMAAEGSTALLGADCNGRSLGRALLDIGGHLMAGTDNGIAMDPTSGLIFSPSHFTWMDTNHPAGTPRQGYPVEIQALWHAALVLLADMDRGPESQPWRQTAEQVETAIKTLFFLPHKGYLADCLVAAPGTPAAAATADDALRPNQLFAVTLGALSDTVLCRQVLAACEVLLVPGGLRSLADRPVDHPLPIVHQGRRLNDPHQPYQGHYEGDEDSQRKPAYHNGTAWTWLLPSFCEAWAAVYGPQAHEAALSWLASGIDLTGSGCVGHIPELLDGDAPHRPRGCDAQAWGVSELLRVWNKLNPLKS